MSEAFALCADDFAISEGVSRAMLELIDAGRLTAVSAMASMPAWDELAAELKARRGRVAIGLHLDLTLRPFEGRRPAFALRRLILDGLARRLDVAAIGAEFERQIDRFEARLGFAPDHVDGHHHVHALPQARDALIAVLAARYGPRAAAQRPLVRDPADRMARIARRRGARAKALTLATLGAGFAARVRRAGFATNDGFAGFSRFAPDGGYARAFPEFLRAAGPRHLVMVHPGFPDDALRALDPVAAARRDEFSALMAIAGLPERILRVRRAADDARGAFADWPDRSATRAAA